MEESIGELKKFIDAIDKDESMQALTRSAKTPDRIIQIAESAGIKTSMKQLPFWSRELKASYFPWAEKGSQWRREFFEKRLLE